MPGYQNGVTSRSWSYPAGGQTHTGPGLNDGCGAGNGAIRWAGDSGLTQEAWPLA